MTRPVNDGDGEVEAMTRRDWVSRAPAVRDVRAELVEAMVVEEDWLKVVDISDRERMG